MDRPDSSRSDSARGFWLRAGILVATIACAVAGASRQQSPKPKSTAHRGPAPVVPKAAPEETPHLRAARDNNIGVALMNRQQFEAALGKFQSACIEDPASDTACLNMGIALVNLQHYDDARKVLARSAERAPSDPYPLYNLGLMDKAEGNPDAAATDFEKVAALDPDDADTQYFLGLLYSQQQHYDKAIAAYKNALRLNEFHLSAMFGLAQAEQRSGDKDAARQHLEKFQHMTAEKLGKPISFVYGEQGKYSLAQSVVPAPEAVPAAVPVHFVNVTSVSGLPSDSAAVAKPAAAHAHSAAGASHNAGTSKEAATDGATANTSASALADFLGAGACIIDADGDGKPDVFLVNADGKGHSALYRNSGAGKFVNVTKAAKLDFAGQGTGCAVGDYDNDGHPDLAVSSNGRVALFHNEGNGTFKDVTAAAGIRTDGLALGLTFIDFDHDGDLDLYVTRSADFPLERPNLPFSFPVDGPAPGNVLWRNDGNGSFSEWTKEAGLIGSGSSVAAIGTDINNDRAIDFVVTGWQKSPTIYFNPREGEFRAATPWVSAMPAPTAGVVALDFDKDGWMDLAFTHWGPPGISLWRNVNGKSFERVNLPELGWMRGWGIAPIDYDNDGWVDLVAVGENFSNEGRIALLRNEGPAGFRDVTAEMGLDKITLKNPRSVIAFDFDHSGAQSLLITQNHLPPVLLKNVGGNHYNYLDVALKGSNDNRSAIGTKVEISAGAVQQKWEIPGASGYLGQGAPDLHVGLGTERKADVVRMLWPTGVLQDELEVAAGKRDEIAEIDRRGSSCPIVFVWNGEKFDFLADMIGPGIVGHWVGPGQRNIPDPREYFKVEGSQVAVRNGRIQFRMLEPMEELDYLDQVRLLAIDHPVNEEVWPNARFLSNPPFPEYKVIVSDGARPPAGAWDDEGRSVLSLLQERDRDYVSDFPDAPYQGFAAMHSLKIDLGDWNPQRPLRLLMDGFTDYFSASSMYAAWQAGISPVPPYVEAMDENGKWVRVVDDMGFPAGLTRTMVADLTGKLRPGTRYIRITTNLKIYWDRIRVDNSDANLPFHATEVPLAGADLRFRGYPRVVEHNPKNDLTYIYEDVSLTGPYTRQLGNYTRYGDVLPLVRAADDEYVIFGSGDEVAVDFDATHLPELPAGWTRDYFFFADGFAKDMDFYAAHGDTVSPMPFHTPVPYPYPAGLFYPQDDAHVKYQLEYNTRGVAGPPGSTYRFNYPDGQNP
jgi:tetratricopeptide (TPR) repeat protein